MSYKFVVIMQIQFIIIQIQQSKILFNCYLNNQLMQRAMKNYTPTIFWLVLILGEIIKEPRRDNTAFVQAKDPANKKHTKLIPSI